MGVTLVPNTPSAWKAYAGSEEVLQIPQRQYYNLQEKGGILSRRDVYLDYDDIVKDGILKTSAHADVIAFETNTIINLSKSTIIVLSARVLTADADVTLEFSPDDSKDSIFIIYAGALDRKFSYTVRGNYNYSGVLDWLTPKPESKTTFSGVCVSFSAGSPKPTVEYLTDYQDDRDFPQFTANLRTQLRIASSLFWTQPFIAISQAANVASATARVPGDQDLTFTNLQAVSIGQQLAAQLMTGPNTNYAPVLVMKDYADALGLLITAAKGFEEQYDRYKDRGQDMKLRLQSCGEMINRAKDQAKSYSAFTTAAWKKYKQASDVVANLKSLFETDIDELDHALIELQKGIKNWVVQKQFEAVKAIIFGVIDFATSIASLAIGMIPKNPAEGAVEVVKSAEKLAGEGKRINADTLKKLVDVVQTVAKLFPTVDKITASMQSLMKDPKTSVKRISDVAGEASNVSAVGSMAAWDRWILDSDYQLLFFVEQKIGGAEEYRLALRKHAVTGKALAQAQAEAIKAGQEYINAGLQEALSKSDIASLEILKGEWEKGKQLDEEVEAKFYDRFMTIRTSIVTQMRNLVWAYKYEALKDSTVDLSVQKTANDYQVDLSKLRLEFNKYLEEHPLGVSQLEHTVHVKDLPASFKQDFIKSLKEKHTASFTYMPRMSPTLDGDWPFVRGSHFRVIGLRVFLEGAVPKAQTQNNPGSQFRLALSTSGVFADSDGNTVYQFCTVPMNNRPFEYSGLVPGQEKIHVDLFHRLGLDDYAAPTPFTNWTLTIKNPDELVLEGLKDVRFEWRALFYAAPGFAKPKQ